MTIKLSRPRAVVELCTDMGLRTEWETATAALASAKASPSGMMVDPDIAAKAQAVVDLENRMKASILLFDLEALRRKDWQEFEAAHRPREGVMEDESFSVNVSTFFDAVLPVSIFAVREKATNKVVDFDPSIEWMPLADQMSDGQYSEFGLAVLRLNRGTTGVPFSQAASRLTAPFAKS